VDTESYVLSVVVHAASTPDCKGGQRVLEAAGESFPRLQHIWADQGYTSALVRWGAEEYGWHGWRVQVVYSTDRQVKRDVPDVRAHLGYEEGLQVIPRRPVVETAFPGSDGNGG